MSGLPHITVIIATSCEAKRAAAISRAVDSVLSQQDVDVDLHVVVNGTRFDPAIRRRLEEHPRIRTAYLEKGSYPGAVWHGRTLVKSEYFAYLDDDDEYLPGALATRVAPMRGDPRVDFVATNGYLNDGTGDVIAYAPSPRLEADPLMELLRKNWMQPCGHLFRSASVPIDYFDAETKYYEWTLLAFKLCQSLRMRFLDVPTYRKHDSPESLYKSAGVLEGQLPVLDIMTSLTTSQPVLDRLVQLRCAALHSISDFHWRAGNRGAAWKYHLRSLGHSAGWIHLPYTRRLFTSAQGAPIHNSP